MSLREHDCLSGERYPGTSGFQFHGNPEGRCVYLSPPAAVVFLAERAGFEPSDPFKGYRLAGGWSRQSPSLSVVGLGGIKPPSLAYQTSALSLSYSPMAGSGGIEPPKPCGPTVFETAPSTSRTLPIW